MSSDKAPMSGGYRAVFVLSILMIFVAPIGGAMSGSKSAGLGVLFWGYTAWKMYGRDNESLVALNKSLLWIEAFLFSVSLAIVLFADTDVRRHVDYTPVGVIVVATISMGVTYLLYKFFRIHQSRDIRNEYLRNQGDVGSISQVVGSDSPTEDRFWLQASRELNGARHEATWARAFSDALGEPEKTKALYIKYRVGRLWSEAQAGNNEEVWTEPEPEPEPLNRGIGTFPLILIGGLLLAIGYQLIRWVSGQPPQ